MEEIKIINDNNIILKGKYFKVSEKKCCIFFHGFAGHYGSLAEDLQKKCNDNGISFLFGYTTGYKTIYPMKKKVSGEKIEILQGGCYENLEDYYIDYNAWFNFLKSENYEDIYVIGHSLACNKLIDYFNKYEIVEVKKIVMLAPQDLSEIIYTQENNISQAKLYMLNNKENEILSEKFLGFCPISAKTFLSFGRECFLHNLKYKDVNFKYQKLKSIKKPIHIFIGENDEGLNGVSADKYMKRIMENANNIQYQVMENCNHTFKNHANVLAEKILKFILE